MKNKKTRSSKIKNIFDKSFLLNKKGQIQMGETIFIIIFIILIIIFGIVFFSQAQGEDMRVKQQKFAELDSITTAQYVSSLTEIKCSSLEVEELSCFDKSKLDALTNLTTNDWETVGEYYVNKLGSAIIRIEELYPEPKNWTVYNYTGNTDFTKTAFSAKQIRIPVSLKDPISQTKAFGVLYLTVYNKVIG